MKSVIRFILPALVLASFTTGRAAEGGANPEDEVVGRLRDALRNTMLQLRDAQGQVATLQAAQVADEQKIKDLETKLAATTKQSLADRNASTNMIAELNTKLEEQRLVLVGFQAAIEKWKKSYAELTAFAQRKEGERAKYQAQSIKLQRQVQDQQVRNIQMYKAGLEILDRYEKFGLGDALLAREPFVGTTRVKFENYIQADQDKLTDQRITTATTSTTTQPTTQP